MINTLILAGGGVKGISYIGVFKSIEENPDKIDIKELIGVSIGSIMGLLYVIGYTSKELEIEIINKNLSEMHKIKILNFLTKYGIDDGKKIIKWLSDLMNKKNISSDITFNNLFVLTNINLRVAATNLNKYNHTFFDKDFSPELKVLDAIRFSISVPLLFSVEKYNDDIHVDGALVNNYPIQIIPDYLLKNTIGIKLQLDDTTPFDHTIKDITNYIYHIIICLYNRKKYNLEHKYKKQTIFIDSGHINPVNTKLTCEEKQDMIKSGYNATQLFFNYIKKNQ